MDRTTKLILMIALEVPAILLSTLILVYFVLDQQARSKPKNHGWMILLIVNLCQLLLDLPMSMSFYHTGAVQPATNAYCVWWTWCEFSLSSIGLFLMAWISIERHLLVFRPREILQNRWNKWILHFLPIIVCLTWAPTYFFVLVIISPMCTHVWDSNFLLCGSPCYFSIQFLSQFDFIFNLVSPIMIIMIANVTLVIRVIHQKMSRQQVINWRRHRKMVLQLWIVSSLYMGFWFPVTITLLVQITLLPSFMADELETIQFAVYFIPLLLPMICLSTLPELLKKIMTIIKTPQMNVVGVVSYNRNPGPTLTIGTVR